VTSPTILATASWLRLLSITHAFQAAMIAGDLDEAARLRVEAHDVLDANLDQRAEAAAGVRALIEGG
jgi:F0F1-type ATP synthase membrane subunit b/b'